MTFMTSWRTQLKHRNGSQVTCSFQIDNLALILCTLIIDVDKDADCDNEPENTDECKIGNGPNSHNEREGHDEPESGDSPDGHDEDDNHGKQTSKK